MRPQFSILITKNKFNSEKLISNKYKFIYISVPKVATRSILTALHREEKVDFNTKEISLPLFKILRDNQYSNYFKFTFIRNPWSRIVSTYLDKIKNPDQKMKQAILLHYSKLTPGMSFQDFVLFLSKGVGKFDLTSDRHWLSQYKFITDKKGKFLVDFIGKIENLEFDWSKVCKKIGLPEIKLPYLNSRFGWKVDKKKLESFDPFYYREYYTDKTRELIRARYQKDIELFDYEF